MLPRNYRFAFLNRTGAALTNLVVTLRPAKGSPIVYGSEIVVAGLPTTLANDAAAASTAIANDVNLFETADIYAAVTVGTSQSGFLGIYLQVSTDGGTTWPTIDSAPTPDEVGGLNIGSIKLSAQTTRAENFVI